MLTTSLVKVKKPLFGKMCFCKILQEGKNSNSAGVKKSETTGKAGIASVSKLRKTDE